MARGDVAQSRRSKLLVFARRWFASKPRRTTMKTHLVTAAVLIGFSSLAFASDDKPGPDWMSPEQVTQRLQAAGYSNITGLEADDGHWEGKGVKEGKIMEFHVDPKSGAITKEEADN
jgi:hypothetical protein